MDPLFFAGGCAFLILGWLALFNRDRLWNLYRIDRKWAARNPERKPEWDERTRRHGYIFLLMGLAALVLSFLIEGRL